MRPLFDADFETDFKNSNKYEKMKSSDVFLVIANEEYANSDELNEDFSLFSNYNKPIIKINLESNNFLRNENETVSNINLFNDTNGYFLNEEGEEYVNLVFELQKKFPKTLITNEKPIDVLLIMSKGFKKSLKTMKLNYKIKYSLPSDAINPNFEAIKSCKVVLAILDKDVALNRKLFEELRFATEIGTKIITGLH